MIDDKALDILSEYYKQTEDNRRTVGGQIYQLLTSVAVAIGGGAILYSVDISHQYILKIKIVSYIIFILLVLLLYSLGSIVFLVRHLRNLGEISTKIEKLQGDILFKKMGEHHLFFWENDSARLKEFLIKDFHIEWIEKLEALKNGTIIKICTRSIFSEDKRIFLILNCETVILIINGVVEDIFSVRIENGKIKVYETELKSRFREIYPNINVNASSFNPQIVIFIFAVIVAIWLYHYVDIMTYQEILFVLIGDYM